MGTDHGRKGTEEMNIVVLDGYALNPGDLGWEGISRFGTLTVYDRTPALLTAERIRDAEIIFTNKTRIGEAELSAAPKLRFIGVLATGYDVLDLAALKAHNITACNVPSYSTMSVAQLTMALLMELCHHVGQHSDAVHSGKWSACPDYCFWDTPLVELDGKTFGVLGTGSIGCAAARMAAAFGMHVIGTSPHEKAAFPGSYVPFRTLLAQSDVLSLHCPCTPETTGVINRETIGYMKDGAILLNTSRGKLVNAPDLADALNSGKLYGAGLDVADPEPISADNPLLTARNCILTPHIAWAPLAARQRLMEVSGRNLEQFLAGKPINRIV